MNQELAETRALAVLGWIAGRDELLSTFLAATGASEADLRARAGEAEFLAAVMDFLLMDDAWLLDCATDLGWRPEDILHIRAALPGGDLPHWT
jgi:hypothetical protein